MDLLFAPPVDEVYPPGFDTTVTVGGLTEVLDGAPEQRGPEHFAGVTTVVTKLLNMAGPDVAYFGQKDAQQALVIRKLVRDLDMPVRIEVCPTVRDADGLALSSRNAYLSPGERDRALGLSRALRAAEAEVAAGRLDAAAVLAAARAELDAHGIEPEYLELRSAADLSPVERVNGSTLLAVAAQVGRARLIDNTILGGTHMSTRPTQRPAITLTKLAEKKALGEPIAMVTAYDFPSAQVAEEAGVDVVLVGDSGADDRARLPLDRPGDARRAAHARLGRAARPVHAAARGRHAVRLLRGLQRAGDPQRPALHQGGRLRRRQARARRHLGRARPRDRRRRHPRDGPRRAHARRPPRRSAATARRAAPRSGRSR